jgi:hypothetical protein
MAGRSRPKREKVRGKLPKAHFASGLSQRRCGSGASTILLMTRPNTSSSRHAGT